MLCHGRSYVLVFFVTLLLALCRVSSSTKPTIFPTEKELEIDEGDLLEIKCTGDVPIKFHYPLTKETVNTSLVSTAENENYGVHEFIFQRGTTVFGDTGWYSCANENVEINPNDHDDPEVNWLYVYVRSDKNLFVEYYPFYIVDGYIGEDAVIPCRPTSPNLTVSFQPNENKDALEEITSFDPKIGFTITNVRAIYAGDFSCAIEKNNYKQTMNYSLIVERKHPVPSPIIHDEYLPHVTRGEDLHINCTVDLHSSVRYIINWKRIPEMDNDRMSTKSFRKLDGMNQLATSEMTILNLTDEDAGKYECFIKTYTNDYKSTSKTILLHDAEERYVNITPQHSDPYYENLKDSSVQWVVYFDGYPRPVIRWLYPSGNEIKNDSRHELRILQASTFLKISSLDISDTGIYTVEAENQYVPAKRIHFTLHVLDKPLTLLTIKRTHPHDNIIDSYYEPNQNVTFTCDVKGLPQPNISLSFQKYPNYPSHTNSTEILLTDAVGTYDEIIIFGAKADMMIEMSGVITCESCNYLGCDKSVEVLLVSDGVGAFGIIEPKDPVVKGDKFGVELTCAASIYNHTDHLMWTNLTGGPIETTERIDIIRSRTRFTYRSTLRINQIKESDAQDYVCHGEFLSLDDPVPVSTVHSLIVYEPMLPFFKNETNMNETKARIIEEEKDRQETIVLMCIAGGLPRPNVTWYKDKVPLKENTDNRQYNFTNNNQQLSINYVLPSDSGTYSCRATNRIGEKETYQEIVVKKKWHKHEIILTTSIAILAIVLLILAIFFIMKVRREKKMRKELMEAGLMHFEEGALECLNPDLTVDDQAELLPYDKKWEFPRERLKLGKQLGSGAFGVVMKAEAQGICSSETVTTVAVKMVRRTTDPTYVRALASELKIMVHLGKHLNVVNLLGACTKNISKRELLVIVEYCRFGNLHNYLLRHRADFINQIDPNTGKLDNTIGLDVLTRTVSVSSNRIKYAALSFSRSLSANSGIDTVHYCPANSSDSQEICLSPNGGCILSNNSSQPGWRSNYHGDYKDHNLKPICTQDLLSWAFQVARGMEYLSQRKVLHGDLAARNILLAEDNIVKICDFGLAKNMYKDGNYKKKGDGPLPIKWMAIESIRDRIFSTQSDIWSYGIVLWEFFTLAETPYPGMEAEKQYQKLIEGYRMEQPEYAICEMYDIMLQCWKAKPTMRPSFTDLVTNIGDLLDESVKSHYISLNTPYMDMNTMVQGSKNDYLTMMSAPDHATLSSPGNYVNSPSPENGTDPAYLRMSPGYQTDESGIFSPRPQNHSHFEFPSPVSDSEDAVEQSPMLKQEFDPYLKPINVEERRAEFARQRQTMKDRMTDHSIDRPIDRDSGYCNAPRNLHLIDLDGVDESDATKNPEQADKTTDLRKMDCPPSIISTHDNYVNMPKQKSDILRNGMPDSFSNPSYVIMINREMDQ